MSLQAPHENAVNEAVRGDHHATLVMTIFT